MFALFKTQSGWKSGEVIALNKKTIVIAVIVKRPDRSLIYPFGYIKTGKQVKRKIDADVIVYSEGVIPLTD